METLNEQALLVIHKQNIKWNRSPPFFSPESLDAHRRSEVMFGADVPAGDPASSVTQCQKLQNYSEHEPDNTIKF